MSHAATAATAVTATSLRARRRAAADARGFTLIEILIVVVILGILAAIVLPQFSNASTVARENTLKDELRYLRTQIAVYRAQHRDLSPGYQNGTLGGAPDALFVQQLTQFTDEAGNTSGSSSNVYKYGAYLLKMPGNSMTSDPSIKIVTAPGPLVADDSTGWIFNPVTGEFVANSTKSDNTGTPYASY